MNVQKAFKRASGASFTIVSRALSELLKLRLVDIKNKAEKTGRMYSLTEKGKKVKKLLENS